MFNLFNLFKKQPENKQENVQSQDLYTSIHQTIKDVKQTLGDSNDVVIRPFHASSDGSLSMALIYTDGLVDKTYIQDFILRTLMIDIRKANVEVSSKENSFQVLKEYSLTTGELSEFSTINKLYDHILSGDTVILIDGYQKAFAADTKGWKDRGVEEPSTQSVVRGPKDGFTETIRTNTALIRRKVKDPNLWIKNKAIGKRTKTDVSIAYINGVADPKIVKEVYKRLDQIDTDAILDSGYVEEFIQDQTYTPFPTVYNTERPDIIAAGLLEGRIAIIVDGTPFVLLVPALFVEFFQASEDYYQRADFATFIRIVRYLAFFLSLLTPSAYIALTTYHQEMIPTDLLISLSSQREGVPFPALVEALIMEITFEILREAGVRLPKAVGSAISIVGALVLGQAAVEAGLVSSAMVIVVSLTAISSFVSPSFNMAISVRMLRFGFMMLAASFGLFGMLIGIIIMILHLTSLRSFGVPYLAPMAPFVANDHKDVILRFPHWGLFSRPRLINQKNVDRENTPAPNPSNREAENQSEKD